MQSRCALAGLLLLVMSSPAKAQVAEALAYTWDSTTLTLDTESTYDWTNDEWTMPINLVVSPYL
ncbi:MAG: hypothetical protein MUO41_14295 [Methyloceanibacter sp.]|nr:hypothetical protein [Methyloceanibacter sp.]